MGMKSKSNHFSGGGAGGPSKRIGNASGINNNQPIKIMSSHGQELIAKAENEKLKNQIKELYRPGAIIGDGGTADALRHENETGETVGGKTHSIKAKERLKALEKLYKGGKLSENDKKIAKDLMDNLEDALRGGKK